MFVFKASLERFKPRISKGSAYIEASCIAEALSSCKSLKAHSRLCTIAEAESCKQETKLIGICYSGPS